MIRTRSSGPSCCSSRTRDEVVLDGVLAGQAELVAPLGDGVFHPASAGRPSRTSWHCASAIQPFDSRTRQGTSNFLGPIRLKTSSSRPSSRTQRRGQAEPAAGLDLGGDPEDGGREQVDLVVDDQAPVALVEEGEVGEVAVLLGPVGDDLVGGERHRRDRLGVAGVGGDQSLVDVGLVEDLAPPLLDGGGAGGQDQRALLQGGHGGDARRSSCRRRRAGR